MAYFFNNYWICFQYGMILKTKLTLSIRTSPHVCLETHWDCLKLIAWLRIIEISFLHGTLKNFIRDRRGNNFNKTEILRKANAGQENFDKWKRVEHWISLESFYVVRQWRGCRYKRLKLIAMTFELFMKMNKKREFTKKISTYKNRKTLINYNGIELNYLRDISMGARVNVLLERIL